MVRVRFVTMQRNEGRRLRAWIDHHAALADYRGLLILDNGSDDPETSRVLDAARKAGCEVRSVPGRDQFEAKGELVADVIREWDVRLRYDFAIPSDADERLAVWTDEGVESDPKAVLAELAQHLGSRSAFRIDTSLFNVPSRPGWYMPDTSFHKSFLPARSIGSLDMGFHWAASRFVSGQRQTRLVWLHEHNGTFAQTRSRARWKLSGRLDLDDVDAVRAYVAAGLPGAHLIATLDMSRSNYLARYDDRLRISAVPHAQLRLPGIDKPIPWSGKAYLDANADVAKHWELTALQHLTRHGLSEGRLPEVLRPRPTRALPLARKVTAS